MKIVIRGYLPEYEKYFKGEGIEKLKKASCDTLFLLSRGYKLKPASNFVTNHYLLSEKQRLAVARSIALPEDVKNRKAKMLKKRDLKGKEVWVDGFNAIIPMETLLSDGPLFECMDGAIRDMADLKGSYKIIDKTEGAIKLVFDQLAKLKVAKVNINMDRPVSNSGRLKMMMLEIGKDYDFELNVELLNATDKSFYGKECVISGDCMVIDNSISWIPLYKWIIDDYKKEHDVWLVKPY
jgi:hypothetical protein